MNIDLMHIKRAFESDQKLVFLPSVFNETLHLLLDSHDYFQTYGLQDQSHLKDRERSMYCCEMSRITMRLSCIMAWLMVRKAVHNGKMSEEEAIAKYQLDCKELCLHQNIQAESILPPQVNALLDKSLELYQRVSRLDEYQFEQEHQITPLM